MHPTLVLDVVGLTPGMLASGHAPHLAALARDGGARPLATILPAVTCSVQSTFVTGTAPREHGIVGNGWYFRDLAEVWLWRQSNRLVAGDKLWDVARRRDPAFTCAKLFWWYNMYSSADLAVTPRPLYPADGRKIADIYTEPAALRDELNAALGQFPLFHFWGPRADLRSSRWITDCALHVQRTRKPTLTLVYLPHLDYDLQRFGPDDPRISAAVRDVDALCGELIAHARAGGQRVVALSEYGITAVRRPIHINRALREAGWLRVREELGTERLDAGASGAFAVSDHQIAHIYVRDPARVPEVARLVAGLPGVMCVLDDDGKRREGIGHARAGELVAVADADAWFTYYFWLDDARAPDYARTVDIHRKPGYDPVELFVDPKLRAPALRVGVRLAQKTLGFRYLMDLTPLDATLVKGSHGRPTDREDDGPVIVSSEASLLPDRVRAADVRDILLRHLFDDAG